MADLDLNAIEARANAATPGPWRYNTHKSVYAGPPDAPEDVCSVDENAYADGAFIARAREDIPALIARVRELEADDAKLEALLAYLNRAAQAEARVRALEDALRDPKVVHANILRGEIALTKEDALHIGGHDQLMEECRARVRELEEQIEDRNMHALDRAWGREG